MKNKIDFYNKIKRNDIKYFLQKEFILSYLNITFGVFLLAIGIYFFYLPENFVTGGVGGIGVIIKEKTGLNMSYFFYIANFVLLIVAYIFLGKNYVFKSLYASILLPTIILIFEIVTKNNSGLLFTLEIAGKKPINGVSRYILITVFGGFFSGFGLGITFNNGGTTGGMDIIQKILNKFLKLPYSTAIYVTDGVVMLTGVLVFGVEKTLFSAISVYIIAKLVDQITFAGKVGFTAFIITDRSDIIKNSIYNKLDRGLTKIKVQGGYSNNDRDLIVCTIGKNQIHEMENIIQKLDPFAFSFIVQTREVSGYGFKSYD